MHRRLLHRRLLHRRLLHRRLDPSSGVAGNRRLHHAHQTGGLRLRRLHPQHRPYRRQAAAIQRGQRHATRTLLRHPHALLTGLEQPGGIHDVFLSHTLVLHRRRHVFALHLTHGHFAVAFEVVVLRRLEVARDVAHPDGLRPEERALQPPRIRPHELLRVTVEQLQLQILPIRRQREQATVSVDGPTLRTAREVVNNDVPHAIRRGVAPRHAHEERFRELIHDLVAQGEGRFRARDVLLQNPQLVIRGGQHLIVEPHHHQRQEKGAEQHRSHERAHTHAAGLERRDLVFRRHAPERVQRRDEHRHRQRHRNREGQGQHEEFRDGGRRQAFAGEIGKLARHVLQHEQRRERGEREHQRADVLAHDVAREKPHYVTSLLTTSIFKGASTGMGSQSVGCVRRLFPYQGS